MALARNIRFLRKKQGWGQDFLAEKLGYKSYTTIQKWESGVSEPPLKVVHALADLFGVDIDVLTGVELEFGQNSSVSKDQKIIYEDDNIRMLIDAASGLPESDIQDIIRYIKFRKEHPTT